MKGERDAGRRRSWLRSLNAARSRTARLLCFPHSGGSATSYAPWVAAMPPDVELMAVQYPGRADRFTEAPADGVVEMAERVADEFSRLEPVPYALFGHSLGALVAYETAIALRDAGTPPRLLMVSGSQPPWYCGGRTHLAPDDELWATISRLGGIAPELAGDTELRELLLPTLRADVTANETYRPRPDTVQLCCPVRCCYGADDSLVNASLLPEWANISTGSCTIWRLPGGHFELFSDCDEIVADIVAALRANGGQDKKCQTPSQTAIWSDP